jgi:type I restriction enzyme S subunit
MTINRYILSSEFCESVRDGTHDTPKRTNSGYRLVTSKHIKNGQINSDEGYFISEKDFKKINERSLVDQWDVLMSMIGTIGEAAIVKDQPKYAIKNVALFKCGDELKAKWLYYFLCSPEGKGQLFSNQKGASQQFVSLTQLRNLQIPIRDQSTMKKITDILSAYDYLIENNQKQIRLLEEAAMRLYKEWFVNLRFPGYENTKIVDGVPEGWRLGRVSELAEFKRGKTITKKNAKDGNVPVVAGGLEPAYFHNVANTVAPVITISASGANAGYTRLYNTDIWASDCSYIDASYGDKLYFIYTFLKNNKEVIDNLQRGAAQPHVYAKDINALSTYIPESTIMEPFCNLVAPLFKKIAVQERLISELKQARDKLLPKLMSGEIEV